MVSLQQRAGGRMSEDDASQLPAEAREILRFWFDELEPEQWWKRDDAVDAVIRDRFLDVHERLAAGVPEPWLATARSRLAAVIALDQFPRNLFRGSARSFATDSKALALAKETIELGLDEELSKDERVFLYVPFQHSEDAADQARSVALFETLADADTLDFAKKHKLIIDRFGRFPHRNAVLGRETTAEEREFLDKESWFW
jgi:uncharacterized protein (DUF924 family)